MASQVIRISLKAYDHSLLDKSTEKIVKTAKSTGAVISGPIPLPTRRTIYTVLRSPFVNKKSREQFQTKIHKRVVDILNSTPKTVESLMKLDLPAVSIIVEHGGSGSVAAAPIAKKLFKLIIDRHELREKNRLEKFRNVNT